MNNFNKKKISEKVKDWFKENFSTLRERGNYKPDFKFNLNLYNKFYNIETIDIGNKTKYVNNIGSRTLLNKSIDNSSANVCYNNNSFDTLYSRLDLIKNLYNRQNLSNVFDESIRLLKDLMDQIAQIYNFRCNNLNYFLVVTSNLYLGKKFLLYNEFKEINEAQKDNLTKYGTPTKDLVNIFYNIVELIIYKSKNKWNENLNNKFSDLNDFYLIEEKETKKNW